MWENEATYSLKQYHPKLFLIRAVFFSILWILMIPLLIKQKIENLKLLSLLYLVLLMFLVIVVFVQGPLFRNYYIANNEYEITILPTKVDNSWILYFFSILLAFYCQAYVLHLRNELLHPTRKRFEKVVNISISLEIVAYMVFGGFAYFCLGNGHIPELIFLRKPYEKNSFELVLQVAVLLFFILNTISLPVYTSGLRENLTRVFPLGSAGFSYYFYSLVPPLLVLIFCIIYPKIIMIFGMLGSTLFYFNGFFMPYKMRAKLMRERTPKTIV